MMKRYLSILIIRKPYLLPVLVVVYQIFLKAGVLCCEWWDIGGFLLSEPTELPANNNGNRISGNIQYPEAIEKLGGLLLDFPPENSSPSSDSDSSSDAESSSSSSKDSDKSSDAESSSSSSSSDSDSVSEQSEQGEQGEPAHEICFDAYRYTVNIDSGDITEIFRDTMAFLDEIIPPMIEENTEVFQVDCFKILIDPLASYIDETHPNFQHFVYYKAGVGMYEALLTANGEVPESILITMFNRTVEANL